MAAIERAWLRMLGLATLGLAGFAGAQQDAASDRAQAFQAVEGAVKEDVPGGPLMVAAYALIWIVLFGFVLRVLRLQAHTEQELERLERALSQSGERAASEG